MQDDNRRSSQTQAELTTILESDSDSTAKVRRVMKLGFEEEIAEDLVERYMLGQPAPVYYERLGQIDYFEDEPVTK